jgi:hypothetical protein
LKEGKWCILAERKMLAAIKMRNSIIFISLFIISCNQKLQEKKEYIQTDTVASIDTTIKVENFNKLDIKQNEEKFEFQNASFEVEKYYSKKIDTINFIKKLEENCHLYPSRENSKTLDKFEKINLNGSTKDFYYIQYSFPHSSNGEFPGKFQIILDSKGKLLKVLSAIRVEKVKIIPNENTYLLALSSTAHGNGGHDLFRINKDTIEQVYSGFVGYGPQTYSTGYNNTENVPNELNHKFIDDNKDGFNDLVFFGKVRYSKIDLGTEDKTANVKFVFLYNKTNGHFTEKEDYSEKYKFIYGATK